MVKKCSKLRNLGASMKTIFTNVKCNLCGADDYIVMYKATKTEYDPSVVISAAGGIIGTQQIVKCKHCGLIYVEPRLESEFVINSYKNSTDELYVSQTTAREKTFHHYLNIVEQYSPKKGRILDVGTASGNFLKIAKENGWEVAGVELSNWLAEYGNKRYDVNIFAGTLIEARYPDNYFDVVTIWDMLEHSTNPLAELKEVNRILKKDGILIINYPDIGTPMAKVAGKHWWFLLSNHLYYFNSTTIRKMLEKNNFLVLRTKMHFQSLELGYLVKMLSIYNKTIANILSKIIYILRLNSLLVKYYASQTNIISRKLS